MGQKSGNPQNGRSMPAYLNFDVCPRVQWPSHVYGSTLVGFIFHFRGLLYQNQVINQFSVYLLCIPSLHYVAEIGLHVPGSLKEQFWTLLGSIKVPGSLKVLGSQGLCYEKETYVSVNPKPDHPSGQIRNFVLAEGSSFHPTFCPGGRGFELEKF